MNACGINDDFNLAEHLLKRGNSDNNTVLTYGGRDITRAELATMSNALADTLRQAGASESDRILLLMLDTPAFSAAFLACMAIGGIPVPLNPKTSAEGLRHIMRDSRARYAVIELDALDTHAQTLRESPYIEKTGIFVHDHYHHDLPANEAELTSRGLSRLNITDRVTPEARPAYCAKKMQSTAFWQYSSGTTGLPKAIKHNQIGMLESTELFARQTLGINDSDKIYSIPKMFFGYGLGNSFFFPLALGAQSLIDSAWPTPQRVVDNIKTYRPTVFFGVPAMYNAMLDEKLGIKDEDLASVRLWFSAGSPLPEQLYLRWQERFGAPILDGIGATEVGHVFLTNSPTRHRAGSTGYPVEGYEVKLITEAGEDAKPGEQGILMVKGPSLSNGYWENPGLNLTKFRDGWYRTGDVFVLNEDGNYRCKGREDDLFKVNGRWVVPVEIESEVQRHFATVKEAVLVGRENSEGMTEPVLFVCADLEESANKRLLSDNILSFLSDSVEGYKRPRDCIILKDLPRNDNGKLLRSQLSVSAGLHGE